MSQSIQDFIAKADELKKLEEKKEYYADRMQKHKGDFNDAEKKYLECERALAKLYQGIVSKH